MPPRLPYPQPALPRPFRLRYGSLSPWHLAFTLVIGLCVCVTLHLKITHDKAMRDAESLISALSNASEQQIGGSLSAIDSLLDEIALAHQHGSSLHRRFVNDIAARLGTYPEVRFVGIATADGILLPHSWPEKAIPSGGINVQDRRYFTAQRDASGPPGMVIGETVIGRASHERTLHVSRPIRGSDGSFQGIVVAALNPDYYAEFLNSILYDAEGSCGLIGIDGRIIARAPNHDANFGRDISDSDLLRKWVPQSLIGVGRLVAKADGNDKLLSYRVLNNAPLVVTAGISINRAMGHWRRMAVIELLILFSFAVVLFYWITRVNIDHKTLQKEQALLEQQVQERTADLVSTRTLSERRAIQLGWVNDELKRLTLVASHHLQEPLRAIVSYSQMIRRSLPQRSAELDAVIDTLCQKGADMKARLGEFEHRVAVLTSSLKQPETPIGNHETPDTQIDSQPLPPPVRTCQIVSVLIIATLVLGAGVQLRADYDNAILSAQNLTGAVTKSIDYHIYASIRRIDNLLNEIALAIEDHRHQDESFSQLIASRLATFPEIRHIGTANEFGLMSPRTWPSRNLPPHGIDISDREYFQQQQQAPEPGHLTIGLPRVGRVAGERSLQLSHPLLGPSGKFQGIVFASINPDHYASYLDSLLLDEDGASAVIGLNGRMLARAPNHIEKFGIDISNSDLFTKWIPQSPQGMAHLISKADGNDKFLGYRVLKDYPLVVTSGISRNKALREWYFLAALEGLIILFAVFFLFHWARRADHFASALRQHRISLTQTIALRTAGVAAALNAAENRAANLAAVNGQLQSLTNLIATDLQTPLRLLSGHVMTLATLVPEEQEDCRRSLNFIRRGNTHLTALLRDFQRFVHMFSVTPNQTILDSAEVVRDAISAIRPLWNEQAIGFDVTPLPTIVADRAMLLDLFVELFTNAATHRLPDRMVTVQVRAYQRNNSWMFTVSDNGPGLPAASGDRLFQAFETAHNRDPDSTGLGLPLCRIIVQSHGGRIWIDSTPSGVGISFSLPVPSVV